MKVFLDANILVSVFNKEYPLFSYTSRILSLSDNKKFQIYTSPICLAIAFYFAEKKSGSAKAKSKIELLVSHINIAESDKRSVLSAIQNKSISDFEDGLEYYAALNAGCKCIITEDHSDFHFSKIEVIGSQQFMEKYLS
jgi:predicted nucleic acid-binding protein